MRTPVDDERRTDDGTTLVAAPGASAHRRARDLLARVLGPARRARELATRPAVRPWLLALTAVLFIALVVSSFQALPDDRPIRPVMLVLLVLVATPSTLALNALQYRTMAAALNHHVGLRSAMRVSIAATLVNYIPAPGGIAVRTAALTRHGSSVRSAISINALTGLLWAGLAALVGGVALLFESDLAGRGAATAAIGALVVAASGVLVRRTGPRWMRIFLEMTLTQTGLVVTSGLRVWLSLAAIGQTASVGAAMVISCSTVIAAMIGIAPAGLGLREAVAGGLAGAVNVSVAAAVAASAVDRVASQVGLLLCGPFTGLRWRDVVGRKQDEVAPGRTDDPPIALRADELGDVAELP